MRENDTGAAMREAFVSASAEDAVGSPANVVDAILTSGQGIARALKLLGNADAGTSMGAIEAHGLAVKEAGERIAGALASIAEALWDLADAVRERGA